MTSWKLQGKQIFLILSVVFLSIALIVKVIFEQTNIPASQLVKSIKLSKVFDVSEKSTVNISIKDDNLRFDFNIQENGALEVNNFSEKLGISNSWMNGFEVGLDKASIEKIRKIDKHWCPGVGWEDMDGLGEPGWVCGFEYYGEREEDFKEFSAIAVTMPLAVCRAALKVVSK